MKHAVILGNSVINVIQWDPVANPGYVPPFAHDRIVKLDDVPVGIGYLYDEQSGSFTLPDEEVADEEE